MSLFKNSKFWSNLALIASILCIASMLFSLIGIRQEWFSTRDAFSYMQRGVQAGFVIIALAVLVIIFARKNTAAVIKSIIALLIVLAPLLILKSNMPAGTSAFARPGPPPGGMGPGGMGPGGMGMAPGGMGGPAADPATAPINDISTDTANPPKFVAVVPLRPERANPVEYAGRSAAAAQAAQFPEIKPINSSLSKQAAFSRALEIAEGNGWQIVAQDSNSGVIEAIASTFFFQYKDDVVIRVTENGSSSIVDIRSHSRIGRADRGKNAERVNDFIADF